MLVLLVQVHNISYVFRRSNCKVRSREKEVKCWSSLTVYSRFIEKRFQEEVNNGSEELFDS